MTLRRWAISLGGGLVIRAAAFDQRISRVVSMDILDDEFEVDGSPDRPGVDGCAARPACRAGAWVGQRAGAAGRRAQARRRMGTSAGHAHHWNGDGLRLPTVDHQVQHPPDLALSPPMFCCSPEPMTTTCRWSSCVGRQPTWSTPGRSQRGRSPRSNRRVITARSATSARLCASSRVGWNSRALSRTAEITCTSEGFVEQSIN